MSTGYINILGMCHFAETEIKIHARGRTNEENMLVNKTGITGEHSYLFSA